MQTAVKSLSNEGQFKSWDFATITKEIRQKAQEELGETDEKKGKCLSELRTLIKGEKELTANTSDEFLLQFLRAKKFRTELSFATLKKFYNIRVLYPTVYQDYSPKQNLEVLQSNLCNFLPLRTSDNCAIWFGRAGLWNPKDFDFETFMKFGTMCHEKMLQNPVTQISGIVYIIDLQGFSLTQLSHMPPSIMRCFVSVVQDCLPMRHKAIHIVNNPRIFGLLFSLMKPFITNKIRNRIYFHGYNISNLHQHVPPCILPQELGGTQGHFENEHFFKSLLDSEEQFLSEQKYGYRIRL